MNTQIITKDRAPALGDVRTLGHGDVLVLAPGAVDRKDWARYLDAIGAAITNGAEVLWIRPGQTRIVSPRPSDVR